MEFKRGITTVAIVAIVALLIGCGQSQKQSQSGMTDSTQVAATEPAQTPPTTEPASKPATQPATSQPSTSKPAASKPSTSGGSTTSQPAKPAVQEPAQPKMVTIPSGTKLTVALETHLRTDSNAVGDRFRARTTDAIRIDEMTVLPAGSEVRGRLTHVEEPHRTAGKAQMTLAFEEIIDPSGQAHSISAPPIALEGEGDKVSDEEKVAGGAVVGGIIGALTSKNKGKGALTGAAAGAAAGGAIALATKGQQLDLPPGQQFSVELSAPVAIPVSQLTAGK